MSLAVKLFRYAAKRAYARQAAPPPVPPGIQCHSDIPYGPHGRENLLDVYAPKETRGLLPAIINVHGGGYAVGSKESYRQYCTDLALRGFTVVNFNYRLAPEAAFPAPLEDTNRVLEWVLQNAAQYCINPDSVFMVGDSAGAQIASQYAVILTNPAYARQFGLQAPDIALRGIGLNCGLYDLAKEAKRSGMVGLVRQTYFGKHPDMTDERLKPFSYLTAGYPPAHITTASHDHIRANAPAMAAVLESHGILVACKEYGTPADTHLKHCFHLNIGEETAKLCNDEQCAFFRRLAGAQPGEAKQTAGGI